MTRKEHIKRHEMLHERLDELAADFLKHNEKLLSKTTIMELIEWSFKQTTNPDTTEDEEKNEPANPKLAEVSLVDLPGPIAGKWIDPTKQRRWHLTGKRCPKCGGKMIFNIRHECGELNCYYVDTKYQAEPLSPETLPTELKI